MKKFIKKLAIIIMIIVVTISNVNIQAITVGSDLNIKDYLHNGNELSSFDGKVGNRLGLLKYNRPTGAVSGWQISYPYFYVENGKKVPVYCLHVYRNGPEVVGAYDVNIGNSIQDSGLLNIILNGYPYKSASQLGVNDDSEAYYITQFAIWIYREGFEFWRWINNRRTRIYKKCFN